MTCDMSGLVCGEKFKGIKMIPPGLHLVCWDAGHDKVIPSDVKESDSQTACHFPSFLQVEH